LYDNTLEFVPVQALSLPPKSQIKKNITPNTNDVDEITKGMANMSLNMAKMAKNINVVAKTVKKF
ncbi:14429_t:CDS:1, partial [Dentiscutata heterogama]